MQTIAFLYSLLFVFNCWGYDMEQDQELLLKWQEFETNYTKIQQVKRNITTMSFWSQGQIDEIRFYLYPDRQNTSFAQEIIPLDLQSLAMSQFESSWPLKIFIHGFGHNYNCSFPQDLKNIYLNDQFQYNLLAVDWGPLSMNSSKFWLTDMLQNYYVAVEHVPLVGLVLGDFISNLWLLGSYDPRQVHIVGFSLGAHIGGIAGDYVQKTIHQKVGRITGLDPAGPLFMTGLVGRHLISTDAAYVEFIHTDMGQSGTLYSLGHSNFFVNGGHPKQPGCLSYLSHLQSFVEFLPTALTGSCSHNAAPRYYAESLNNRHIIAKKCFSYLGYKLGLCEWNEAVVFGEFSLDFSIRGNFYFKRGETNMTSIYSC